MNRQYGYGFVASFLHVRSIRLRILSLSPWPEQSKRLQQAYCHYLQQGYFVVLSDVRCPILYCTVLRSSHLDTLVLAMLYQDQTCIDDFDSLQHVPLLFTIAVIGTFSRKAISDERSVSFGYSDNKTRARVTINTSADLVISCALLSSHALSVRLYGEYTQRPLIGHYTYRLHITSLVLVR